MAATKKGASSSGFSADELAAMKARAAELKTGRGGNKKAKEAEACLEAISDMPDGDRVLAERIHAIVHDQAPDLLPKTWYGMPAYANEDGKVICFYKPSSKFGMRYSTFGFNDAAMLDDGDVWATEFAVTKLTDTEIKKFEKLVKKAAG